MDIHEVLKKDHRAVADLFETIEATTTERAEKGRKDLFGTLQEQLLANAQIVPCIGRRSKNTAFFKIARKHFSKEEAQ